MDHEAAAVQDGTSRSPYSLRGTIPGKPWSISHKTPRLDAARAERVKGLLLQAESKMDAMRRLSWRWRILMLRAELDCALARKASAAEMEPFFSELARIYHVVPKTRTCLVPPSKPLWLSVVGNWYDFGL